MDGEIEPENSASKITYTKDSHRKSQTFNDAFPDDNTYITKRHKTLDNYDKNVPKEINPSIFNQNDEIAIRGQ